MKKLAFALLVCAAPAFAGDLRLFNPSDQAVAVRIACDGGATSAVVAPHAVVDAAGDGCSAWPAAPLVVLRTGANDGVEWQQAEAARGEACAPTTTLFLPLNGCRFGSAAASVTAVDGASYSWSIEGGSILSGAGSDRIVIALEGGDVARASVAISKDGCTTTVEGVMSLHDALKIMSLDAGKGNAGEPRSITWSYANGDPSSQVLSGADFPAPVALPPGTRSYTFTPLTPGDREIVLQASLAPGGRSRAVAHGGGASSCGSARASASLHVDCTRPETNIVVPGTVSAGKPFTASVSLAAGSTASWTVSNGTPATATGDRVTITPLNHDPVDIAVTVTAYGCSASATAHVIVDLAGVCDNPTATVAVTGNDCAGAVVEAIFTGKPPFHGTWSDGTPFSTSAFRLDRAVSSGTATYSIATFSDAYCAGAASNAVTLTVKKPTVTLTMPNGACPVPGTVTATFTGVPPFHGTWSDGVTFSTNSTTLQRSVPAGGPLSMTFGDANCSGVQSETITFRQAATAALSFAGGTPACVLGNTQLVVEIDGGTPPYRVTWGDGYVQQSTASQIYRGAYSYSGIYTITRVQDVWCDLALTKTSVSAPAARSPYFYFVVYDEWTLCADTEYVAHMVSPPGSGESVTWRIVNGTIVSGQGTQDLHFKPVGSGTVTVTADLTFSGCTNTAQQSAAIRAQVKPAAIAQSPSTVKAGQPVTITVTGDTQWYTVTASPRPDLLVFVSKTSLTETVWKYTPASTGTVTILVHETGNCDSTYVDSTATINATP